MRRPVRFAQNWGRPVYVPWFLGSPGIPPWMISHAQCRSTLLLVFCVRLLGNRFQTVTTNSVRRKSTYPAHWCSFRWQVARCRLQGWRPAGQARPKTTPPACCAALARLEAYSPFCRAPAETHFKQMPLTNSQLSPQFHPLMSLPFQIKWNEKVTPSLRHTTVFVPCSASDGNRLVFWLPVAWSGNHLFTPHFLLIFILLQSGWKACNLRGGCFVPALSSWSAVCCWVRAASQFWFLQRRCCLLHCPQCLHLEFCLLQKKLQNLFLSDCVLLFCTSVFFSAVQDNSDVAPPPPTSWGEGPTWLRGAPDTEGYQSLPETEPWGACWKRLLKINQAQTLQKLVKVAKEVWHPTGQSKE